MILDPQNMGLDTLIVELCALLAEIWRNIHLPLMASLICIKMVCGTFYQLFNISNRFLWHFSNLETSIWNWFPGGARYPLLLTRLIWHRILFCPHLAGNVWIAFCHFSMLKLLQLIFPLYNWTMIFYKIHDFKHLLSNSWNFEALIHKI